MDRGSRFERSEVAVCAHIALHGSEGLEGIDHVAKVFGRSNKSIVAKVCNITAMLKAHGKKYCNDFQPLSGHPTGQPARDTDWDIVAPYAEIPRLEHLAICRLYVPHI